MAESIIDDSDRSTSFIDRYARSRVRNAPVRLVFVLLASSIILAIDSFPLAFVCLSTVLLTEALDCLANSLWSQKTLKNKYVLVITAIFHSTAASLAAVVTWTAGGEVSRFLVCMLYAGAMLNVGLTIFLFPLAAFARILIYMATILGLFIWDGILIFKGSTEFSEEKFWADAMGGLLCMFVVCAFIQFIYRYQMRKVENEKIIAAQHHELQQQVADREKQMERLKKATEDAEQANSVKSSFLATMSHEIRTPMNGIIGIAELLNETQLDETQSVYVDTISQSGDALLSIINDILDFSKLEAQKATLANEDFDIHRALEDVATLLSAKRTSAKVELVTDIDPAIPQRVRGDVGKFRQILVNIIGNALKFTEYGHVLVRMEGTKVKPDTYNIKIVVEDTGIGIPENQIDHVFGAFSQVDSQATRKFEGTGLGLAITHRLISLMGGDISVASTLGKGTTFTINIPFLASLTASTLRSPLPIDLSGTNCLIVDDLELNRTVLRRRLETWGARCQLCARGNEAIDTVRSAPHPFGLIILDYQMPDINGADVYQQIRKLAPETPVILFSSVDSIQPGDVPGAEILFKPMRKSLLEAGISRALGRKRAEQNETRVVNSQPQQEIQTEITPGTKILIADDNKTNQMVIRSMLKAQDISTRYVETGKEAVEQYHEYKPDLILMDISMPEMNGYDATKAIREIEHRSNVQRCPILALTANAMKEQVAECLQAGMDGHISKPVTKAVLISRINSAIERGGIKAAKQNLSLANNT